MFGEFRTIRDIRNQYSFVINTIDEHIENKKPLDDDLLTEAIATIVVFKDANYEDDELNKTLSKMADTIDSHLDLHHNSMGRLKTYKSRLRHSALNIEVKDDD